MTLFDDIQRTRTGPAKYSENRFAFYNESARVEVARIRHLLEAWFANYPEKDRAELRARFRADFEAAFFELYIHALLCAADHEVETHPKVPNSSKTPDFFATPIRGEPIYIEAAVATDESAAERALRRVSNQLWDDFNAFFDPNFFFGIAKHEGTPARHPSREKLHRFLRDVLSGLDPEDVKERMLAGEQVAVTLRRTFEHDGLVLEVYPIPKSVEGRGRPDYRSIGIGPVRVMNVDNSEAIRTTIKRKASRYGELDRPFIIAVNAIVEWGAEESDFREALYGREVVIHDPASGEIGAAHDGSGAFVHEHRAVNTRVSAVLGCTGISPRTVAHDLLRLYHHLGPQRPYSGPLTQLPQCIRDGEVIKNVPGLSPNTFFSLPPQWPFDPGDSRGNGWIKTTVPWTDGSAEERS